MTQDAGGTWAKIKIPPVPTFGPPSMAIADGQFYLVWADATTIQLRYAVTASLQAFTPIEYSDGCHGGGPALLGLPDRVMLGWSHGAPPEDPRARITSRSRRSRSSPRRARRARRPSPGWPRCRLPIPVPIQAPSTIRLPDNASRAAAASADA
jgi:hypothetical protein